MSEKQAALDLIERLPDTASFDDILDEFCVRRNIERGIRDMREGRIVSQDEVKRRIAGRTG